MPRYLVEADIEGQMRGSAAASLARAIGDFGVTWIQSYVGEDGHSGYCLLDGPDPETVRRAAKRCGWRVARVVRVSVLDPAALT